MSKKNNPEYQHVVHLTKEEMRNISYALGVTVSSMAGIIHANEIRKLEQLAGFISDAIKKWEM